VELKEGDKKSSFLQKTEFRGKAEKFKSVI
jgi:hypothetical protein